MVSRTVAPVHVPDGFLTGPATIATNAVALAAVALALRSTRRELGERTVPLAGLIAAFMFTVQLASVPIAVGTSVHILGGVFAAVLLGPATALVCASVVLLMQSFVMGFGGISALGASMIAMDLVPILAGYATFIACRAVICHRQRSDQRRSIALAAGIAATVASIAGAATFIGLLTGAGAGAVRSLPFGLVVTTVLGGQLITGIVEGILTAAGIGMLLHRRPDLVRGVPRPALAVPA